jgi:hypothetical protein
MQTQMLTLLHPSPSDDCPALVTAAMFRIPRISKPLRMHFA